MFTIIIVIITFTALDEFLAIFFPGFRTLNIMYLKSDLSKHYFQLSTV